MIRRRRPFLLGGCACALVALWLIAFSRHHRRDATHQPAYTASWLELAPILLGFYVLDGALNVMMCVGRALMVDVLPVDAQAGGSAWASAAIGLGNLLGYGLYALYLSITYDVYK